MHTYSWFLAIGLTQQARTILNVSYMGQEKIYHYSTFKYDLAFAFMQKSHNYYLSFLCLLILLSYSKQTYSTFPGAQSIFFQLHNISDKNRKKHKTPPDRCPQ